MAMLFDNVKSEVKIVRVDNGFILEWEKKRVGPQLSLQSGQYEPDPRGKEIISKLPDLMKRIKEVI